MADFPAGLPLGDTHIGVISPVGASSLGAGMLPLVSASPAWPVANQAIFVPFRIAERVTVCQMVCGTGTATTGNFDLGVYDWSGNRLLSTGSTAKTTATAKRVVDVTDTTLSCGSYYLAMAVDTLNAAYVGWSAGNLALPKLAGIRQMASAFPLPTTTTFATNTGTVVPLVAAILRAD